MTFNYKLIFSFAGERTCYHSVFVIDVQEIGVQNSTASAFRARPS